ncbi:hypothetical protein EB061_12280, partial [bacterium]|nr:hypothetical protein [bacterium]
ESVPADRRSVRVLVPSQPGLEDSSRYWSLNGVLEHLMIVSRSAEEIILSLASGNIPSGKADTAAVKPTGRDGDRLAEYREYAPGCLARIDARLSEPGMNADSLLTFRHPWFGEITAHQWYWLSATHLAIHYRQSKAIVKGL